MEEPTEIILRGRKGAQLGQHRRALPQGPLGTNRRHSLVHGIEVVGHDVLVALLRPGLSHRDFLTPSLVVYLPYDTRCTSPKSAEFS